MKIIRSVEAVGRGHPDKIADSIADSILDELVLVLGTQQIRFAGEVLVSSKTIFFAGEGSCFPNVNFGEVAKKRLNVLGYCGQDFEFKECYRSQSPELKTLNDLENNVSGDQGIFVGYACTETEHYLPLEYVVSKEISFKLKELITERNKHHLREDWKLLVNLELDNSGEAEKGAEVCLHSLVFSIHHEKKLCKNMLESYLKDLVFYPILEKRKIKWDIDTKWLINPSGSFLIGGLDADSGGTNRKQICDLYGPLVHHGGGGLSGKDLTKIDRLGMYYARWVAKNIVASGLVSSIELKFTFSIAQEKALSIYIVSQEGFSKLSNKNIHDLIESCFPTRFRDIFSYLSSERFSFLSLCEISHFGDFLPNLPWEQLNKVTDINEWKKRRT